MVVQSARECLGPSDINFILTTLCSLTRRTTLRQFLQGFIRMNFMLHGSPTYSPCTTFLDESSSLPRPRRSMPFAPSPASNQNLGESLFQNGMPAILRHFFVHGAAGTLMFGPGSGYPRKKYRTMVTLLMCWARRGQLTDYCASHSSSIGA